MPNTATCDECGHAVPLSWLICPQCGGLFQTCGCPLGEQCTGHPDDDEETT